MTNIRKRAVQGLKVGDTFTISRTFTQADVLQFGDISRDYNPVHYDERFVAAKGLKARICHGLLVGGMITEIGGQLGLLASNMNLAFKKPVYIEETIDCRLTINELDERGVLLAHALFLNQAGEIVLEADLSGLAPNKAEREIMQTMPSTGDPANKASRETIED